MKKHQKEGYLKIYEIIMKGNRSWNNILSKLWWLLLAAIQITNSLQNLNFVKLNFDECMGKSRSIEVWDIDQSKITMEFINAIISIKFHIVKYNVKLRETRQKPHVPFVLL